MLQTKFLFPKNLQDISSSNETECVNKGKGGGGFRLFVRLDPPIYYAFLSPSCKAKA